MEDVSSIQHSSLEIHAVFEQSKIEHVVSINHLFLSRLAYIWKNLVNVYDVFLLISHRVNCFKEASVIVFH